MRGFSCGDLAVTCRGSCRAEWVILAEYDWPQWSGEEPASEQELLALLKPCPDEALKIWPVDRMVGNVRNNGPQLILPVPSNAAFA
jgi:putative SOS response-associated peptidase YedK